MELNLNLLKIVYFFIEALSNFKLEDPTLHQIATHTVESALKSIEEYAQEHDTPQPELKTYKQILLAFEIIIKNIDLGIHHDHNIKNTQDNQVFSLMLI